MRIFAILAPLFSAVLAAGAVPAHAADPQPADAPAAGPAAPEPTRAPAAVTAPAEAAPATSPPAAAGPQPANDQVVVPQLDRRDVRVVHIPSNNYELGLFTGTYNAENFGSNLVGGLRFGYHITEDFFVEGVYGQTKVSDQTFRQILPGGIFPTEKQILRYYDLSAGYNVFPGEIFLARNHAKVSTVYVVAGIGSTKFDGASHQTINAGLGMRVFLAQWAAVQFDARDHVFSLDLLGTRKDMQNLEFTLGLTFFF
jgi:outer membrane beta-barrel protein